MTTENVPDEQFPATQRTLKNPLLLELIFARIAEEHFLYSSTVLARCARVNNQWFHEAVRVLWWEWRDSNVSSPLTSVFRQMQPMRRQFYSDFIHRANLSVGESDDLIETIRSTFEDISFPNLHTLFLRIPGRSYLQPYSVEVPIFQAPRLTALYLDPQFEPHAKAYFVFQGEWKVLLDLITARFPNLEEIVFQDSARVGPGELQKLKGRLPYLKHLQAEKVVEASYVDRAPFVTTGRSQESFEPLSESDIAVLSIFE